MVLWILIKEQNKRHRGKERQRDIISLSALFKDKELALNALKVECFHLNQLKVQIIQVFQLG